MRPDPAAAADPLLGHYRDGDMVFQWHMDTFEPPAGATLLATGDRVRNQAFRAGERTWGVQWHFEIDRPELEFWLDTFSHEGDLDAEWGKSPDEVRAEADALPGSPRAEGTRAVRSLRRGGAGDRAVSESYRPLIAVVGYHLAPGRVTRWPDGGYGVPGPYIDALRRSGARVLIVSPGETNDPEEILAPFDGLLLVGGGDVDPSRYGGDAERGAHVRRRARPRPARDRPAARRRPARRSRRSRSAAACR